MTHWMLCAVLLITSCTFINRGEVRDGKCIETVHSILDSFKHEVKHFKSGCVELYKTQAKNITAECVEKFPQSPVEQLACIQVKEIEYGF